MMIFIRMFVALPSWFIGRVLTHVQQVVLAHSDGRGYLSGLSRRATTRCMSGPCRLLQLQARSRYQNNSYSRFQERYIGFYVKFPSLMVNSHHEILSHL